MAKLLLKNILKCKNLSKRQFAKLIGIKYENVFRYFKRDYDPKLSSLETWANALDVKISDLYKERSKKRI